MQKLLGNLILAHRMQHVSQALVADHLGISQAGYSNKVHGHGEPFSDAQKAVIARVLRVFEPSLVHWLFIPVELTERRPGLGDRHFTSTLGE